MRPLTDAELSRMRRFSEAQMLDTGVVLTHVSGVRNSRGRPTETWTEGPPIRCTFVLTAAREALHESAEAAITDATVYVPYGTVIGRQDRFRLTARFGQAISPITYQVLGQPAPDVATIRVTLRAGED